MRICSCRHLRGVYCANIAASLIIAAPSWPEGVGGEAHADGDVSAKCLKGHVLLHQAIR